MKSKYYQILVVFMIFLGLSTLSLLPEKRVTHKVLEIKRPDMFYIDINDNNKKDNDELATANVRKKVTFIINKVTPLERKRDRIVINMPLDDFKAFVAEDLYRYKCRDGYVLSYFNPATGDITDTRCVVSQEIMTQYPCEIL